MGRVKIRLDFNIWPKLKFNWLSIPGPFLIFSPFCSEVKVKQKKHPGYFLFFVTSEPDWLLGWAAEYSLSQVQHCQKDK